MGENLTVKCIAYVAIFVQYCIYNRLLSLWGVYIFLSFLAAYFQLVVYEKLWCLHFLNSRLPLVIGLVLFLLNQDGLFLYTNCSLAALFQTTKTRMFHVASGRGGVLLCW